MFGPAAYRNLTTELSDFREMRALYLYVPLKACHITNTQPIGSDYFIALLEKTASKTKLCLSPRSLEAALPQYLCSQYLRERTRRPLLTAQQPCFPSTVAAELHQLASAQL